jgi:Tol biopolymer transport system component
MSSTQDLERNLQDLLRDALDRESGPDPLWDESPAAHRIARHGRGRSARWPIRILGVAAVLLIGGSVAVGALRLWQRMDDPIDGLGSLAFIRQGDLYLAEPDGTEAALVAHVDGSPLSSPLWSPDGRWIAVQTPEPAVLVLDTSTLELRRLMGGSISAQASDWGPWRVGGWSPDSSELAVLTTRGAIAFVRVPGGGVRELPGWPERTDPFPGPIAWSPDGRWLLTRTPTEESPPSLIRVDPISGEAQPIVPPSEFWDYWPTWSPDSSRIAFTRNSRRLDGLWIAGVDGSDVREIVDADGGPFRPTWSPDGAWIAFVSLDRSNRADELVVVRPDGSDRRRLAGGVDGIVGWSLDGSSVGYTARTDDGRTELHVVSVPGGSDRVLLVPEDGAEFAWATPRRSDPGVPRTALPSSPVPSSPPGVQIGEPAQGEPVRPDATWPGLAYRVQVGDSDCAVAVLRFPAQVTVLPPPQGAPAPSAGSIAPSSVAETPGPQPVETCEPRFAPDGSAVMRALGLAATFEVMRLDGTLLSSGLPSSDTPTWSPAGGWLAARSCGGDGGCQGGHLIIRPDGSDRRELPGRPTWSADDRIMAVATPDGTLLVGDGDGTDLRAIGSFPSPSGWSPDGSSFVFVRDGNAWIARADGTDVRNVTGFDLGGVTGAWWSPDGRWIAVLQGSVMWLMSPDGAVRQRIGTGMGPGDGGWGQAWTPVWSPDGAWLAIEHGDQVTLVRLGDSLAVRLTNAWQPVWSSHGRHLAIVSEDGNGGYRVDVANADGTGRRTVATGVAYPPLTWVPPR